jgi:NADH-quinone oxidoreductase subunit H
MGALRASAQMISYELALGLSLVGAILIYGTFDFTEMIAQQSKYFDFELLGQMFHIRKYGIFFQPLGAIIYFAATFAETNRLPFDLPEAEGELVVGYHTEYGGLKMLMFYIGEYGHMMVGSALFATFYLGGYVIPFVSTEGLTHALSGLISSPNILAIVLALIFHVAFFAKVLLLLWVFVWVRWTLPRFRYDQLMDLGWKTMLPWALANVVITAIGVVLLRGK